VIKVERIDDFTEPQYAALRGLLEETGMSVEMPERRFDEDLVVQQHFAWLILLAAPLVPFLTAFGTEVGKRAGADAYDGLKLLVRRVWGIRPIDPLRGDLTIVDTEIKGRAINIYGVPPADEIFDRARELDLITTEPVRWIWHGRAVIMPTEFDVVRPE